MQSEVIAAIRHTCPPYRYSSSYVTLLTYSPIHATHLCLDAVKLVTRPSDISATVRSWTDGRLACLRGETMATSHRVTHTCF
eukprot:5534328-Pleurochrysis_carterae.AAC.1